MLKALELVGFKSFADRTRFEFPDGITVVVGPNGSGKSNIVDAIKWVLGTQSPKSLRGKEMTDVIFKGASGRKPAGAAEATIIFSNADGQLPVDAPEVHLTRRVYRSGEGEYLLNGQPCRLKDVRDLIRGSGIGVDAYSLIEQGKVDRLLQASSKDRRAIFEEAAGISRFKAKKTEALRRLGRVDQNLLRLGDIVEEVADRLSTLKTQASRAESYRQKTERLKEVRTQLAWTDWFEMQNQLAALQQRVRDTAAEKEAADAAHRQALSQREESDQLLQGLTAQIDRGRAECNDTVRKIAALTGNITTRAERIKQLRLNVEASRRRLLALHTRAGSTAVQLHDLRARSEQLQTEAEQARAVATAHERRQADVRRRTAALRREADQQQAALLAGGRELSQLQLALERTDSQREQATRQQTRLEEKLRERAGAAEQLQRTSQTQASSLADLEAQAALLQSSIQSRSEELADRRRLLQRRKDEIAALRGRLQAVQERIDLLEALERKHEGVATSVQSILARAQEADSGPLASVRGMVADLLQADVHIAPLVDLVLSDNAQALAVSGSQIADAIADKKLQLSGRAQFIQIDALPPKPPSDRIRLDGLSGVVGRVDRLVRFDEDLEPLFGWLLGSVWLVDSLTSAMRLQRFTRSGLRFITRSGEIVSAYGRLTAGSPGDSTGLVSRRSELLEARQELKLYRFQLKELQQEATRLSEQVDTREAERDELEAQHRDVAARRGQTQSEMAATEARLHLAQQEVQATGVQLDEVQQQRQRLDARHGELTEKNQRRELTIRDLEQQLAGTREQLEATEEEVASTDHDAMSASSELSRLEQRLETLQLLDAQLSRDHQEHVAALTDIRESLDKQQFQICQTELEILTTEQRVASQTLRVEQLEAAVAEANVELATVRADSQQAQRRFDAAAEAARRAQASVTAAETAFEQLGERKRDLVERLKEDYDLDLQATEPPEEFTPVEDRDAARAEIVDLRRKLENVGSVNMEALQELEELQSRYDTLHGQYQDLTAAKDSLQQIVHRIDNDSRRLFLETLEAIRTNFQALYRRSFGGGHADLVLEDPLDPLESGVEIRATPPGKPEFSNSLLSGGEKALTAVALLMAIFQYRPSPFCILDEVDAPFDEANIGRFVTVLRQFLDQTKFVVVTHSKKTMTAATTLYGVTMQQSGVSTQVAVKFEDVDDNGQILSPTERKAA